jgi:beta-lactamase superfamily II metal-dependent hydrolase
MWMLIVFCAGCGMPELIDPITSHAEPAAGDGGSGDVMRVVFIDVGQGDTTLVVSPGGDALLIDAGPEGAGRHAVLPAIRGAGMEQLTAIIATHYHADHIGGVAEVMRGEDNAMGTSDDLIPLEGIMDRGGSYEGYSSAWSAYRAAAEGMRETLHPGNRFAVGEISVEVVAARGELGDGTTVPIEPSDENAASLALVIEYGAFRMFVGGDFTGGGGNPPYDTPDVETGLGELVGDVDVLQVNHHGSTTSTNQAFLDALQPEIAIISCGDHNDHFHPHQSVIDRLLAADVDVYQTERCWTDSAADVTVADGDIVLTTDGSSQPSLTLPARSTASRRLYKEGSGGGPRCPGRSPRYIYWGLQSRCNRHISACRSPHP